MSSTIVKMFISIFWYIRVTPLDGDSNHTHAMVNDKIIK